MYERRVKINESDKKKITINIITKEQDNCSIESTKKLKIWWLKDEKINIEI